MPWVAVRQQKEARTGLGVLNSLERTVIAAKMIGPEHQKEVVSR
jgi:hypothetical protein